MGFLYFLLVFVLSLVVCLAISMFCPGIITKWESSLEEDTKISDWYVINPYITIIWAKWRERINLVGCILLTILFTCFSWAYTVAVGLLFLIAIIGIGISKVCKFLFLRRKREEADKEDKQCQN